jgi:hypothetical protein
MLSPDGILPEPLIDPAERAKAFDWILAQPQESRWKVRVWKGYLRTVGLTGTSQEYAALERAGLEK